MTCKPLKGVLRGESRLAGKLASSRVLGPDGLYFDGTFEGVATGIYRQNIIQTHQFQQVLEELRVQHQPEHFASWALDGSLEEDRGQFPIVHESPRLEWVQVGNRLGLSGELANREVGFSCGLNSDFNYIHNEREFTVGLWVNSKDLPADIVAMGTNISSTSNPGFNVLKIRGSGGVRFRVFGDIVYQPQANTGIFDHFEFIVARCFPAPSNSFTLFSAAQPIITGQPQPPGDFGNSLDPMSFLYGTTGTVPVTILNIFATNHILTDAEIYRLYVAGLNDIQVF